MANMIPLTANEKNHANYIVNAVGFSVTETGTVGYASKTSELNVEDLYTAEELHNAFLKGLVVLATVPGSDSVAEFKPVIGVFRPDVNNCYQIGVGYLSDAGNTVLLEILSKEAYVPDQT